MRCPCTRDASCSPAVGARGMSRCIASVPASPPFTDDAWRDRRREQGGLARTHLPSGPDPERFAARSDGRGLYVANEDDAKVSFVEIAARNIVAEVAVVAGQTAGRESRWPLGDLHV